MPNKRTIIVGPCAAESEEQISLSIKETKKRGLRYLRVSLWKPRTKPGGFDGLKEEGIDLLKRTAREGLVPATEVMLPRHAEEILKKIPEEKVLFWIGARNQNHFLQKEIARIVMQSKNAHLLLKNQPWPKKDHWAGTIGHIEETGIDQERLILCHRGFSPLKSDARGYRNPPDYEMAVEIKRMTGLPMIIDPSHIGGSKSNVFQVVEEAKRHDLDGMMVETHPFPERALTDKDQQLTFEELDELLNLYEKN